MSVNVMQGEGAEDGAEVVQGRRESGRRPIQEEGGEREEVTQGVGRGRRGREVLCVVTRGEGGAVVTRRCSTNIHLGETRLIFRFICSFKQRC